MKESFATGNHSEQRELRVEKRLYPIVLLTVLLALLAAAGYNLPPSEGATPIRVLLDNKGGKIVFEHKAHAEGYGLECSSCHHAENLDKGISPCGECHNAETEARRDNCRLKIAIITWGCHCIICNDIA